MRTSCRVGLGLLATAMILGWGGVARGAIKYVTPTGGGLVDGSDWANAFSKRINLGAYGNTPSASVTYRPEGAMMILR